MLSNNYCWKNTLQYIITTIIINAKVKGDKVNIYSILCIIIKIVSVSLAVPSKQGTISEQVGTCHTDS